MNNTRLTARPHAFAGAVLAPRHAKELTPTVCLAIAAALADQNPKSSAQSVASVPYTLWISEAWRVMGWAEPSAALFWEMATMYHTLLLAGRQMADNPNIPPILSCGSTSSMGSGATSSVMTETEKKKFSTVASAKELPVWLVGTFLLLHCEENAYERNLAGTVQENKWAPSSNVDFSNLFKNPALSTRTRLHASQWNNDNSHCTAYILRHLRKILLLSAMSSSNREALHSAVHLSSIPAAEPIHSHSRAPPDANELRRQHNDEHGSVGLPVRLTMEDLDKLDLVLQPPRGGEIDAPPLQIGEFLWKCLYTEPPPPMASIALGDVEREIRQHLEMELLMNNLKDDDKSGSSRNVPERSSKEIMYFRLRGTTVMLKPNVLAADDGGSVSSVDPPHHILSSAGGRLPDLVVSDCSDAHFYLLRPFEYAAIVRCSNCTIVVGAVAGLLHVTDCEKLSISVCGRRILISNSCDVVTNLFSPSPPLLVGDNRTCQFAPFNTNYDGLREDLLATGLAAAVPSNEAAETTPNWPPLQCASNKWKQPVEVSKLEVPQVPNTGSPTTGAPLSPGADDRAMGTTGSDTTLQAPILQPPSEYSVLFVPLDRPKEDNMYCRLLGEIIQLSPFRMPMEYEKSALAKPERMKHIQSTVQKKLTPEQQKRFEEELNRGFRDWLVTSGNLRQVLDLVHMEEKQNS